MKRRILAILLTICMVATLLPTAFAAEAVAKVGESSYETVQAAVNAAEGGTVTLLKDTAEDVAISGTVTLNLGGFKLTNASGNTITVNKDANLTIEGEGTVDNVTHGKAAIYNMGTVEIKGGTIERSAEAGVDASNSGGNSYYTILNHGTMTVQAGVTVNNKGRYSSLFENGYFDYSKNRDGIDAPTLTINGGLFDGGLNTIKNDDGASLTINNGTFKNYTQAAFMNHNIATVNGGEFLAESLYAIYDCGCVETVDIGKLTITAGTFNGKIASVAALDDIQISGGTFTGEFSKAKNTAKITITGGEYSADVSAYVPDGYILNNGKVEALSLDNAVAKINETPYKTLKAAVDAATEDNNTVTLLRNVSGSMVTIKNTVTIDLNGHTITKTAAQSKTGEARPTLYVDGGSLTLDDSSADKTGKVIASITGGTGGTSEAVRVASAGQLTLKNGTLASENTLTGSSANAYGVILLGGSKFVMENGEIDANAASENAYGVVVFGKCEFEMKNGVITSNGLGISGNGSPSEGDTKITISNGSVTGRELAIYIPQNGSLTLKGGNLTGRGGIEAKSGNTTVTIDGNPTITATATPTHVPNNNGNSTVGYAIAIVENNNYAGGATATIDSGRYKGPVSVLKDNEVDASKKGSITINGGYFTIDPSAYCDADHTGVASNDAAYPYTVGEKNVDAKPAHVDSTTVPASTAENASEQVKKAAEAMTEGAALANNAASEAAAKDLANDNKTTGETKVDGETTVMDKVNETLAEGSKLTDADDVAIVYQTYVDVTVSDAKHLSGDTITEITVDMTPKYRVVATTNSVVEGNEEIKADGDNKNAVVIEDGKKLSVPAGEYEVKLAIPSALAKENDKLAIKHTKDNGTVEYYTGTVTQEGTQLYVTFTTNGFSPFTIYAADASVAQIGENVYISLDEAIKAVENDGTIKLLKDNLTGTVSRTIKFTVDENGKTGLKLTAGAGYAMTKDGNTYTFTYVYSGTTTSKGLPFTDVSTSSPYYDGIKFVYENGIMKGVTGTTFEPGTAVTRGMLVTLLYRYEGSPAVTGASFSDVAAGRYFTDAVAWASKNDIVTGYSDGTFQPDAPVSRQQLAVILYRYAVYKGMTAVTLEDNLGGFTDSASISAYAIPAMNWAVGQGLVNGYSDGTVRPAAGADRAQTAVILMRLIENVLG